MVDDKDKPIGDETPDVTPESSSGETPSSEESVAAPSDAADSDGPAEAVQAAQESGEADKAVGVVNPEDASEDDAEAEMMAMLEDLPQEEPSAAPEDIDFGSQTVANAQFQQLSEPSGKSEPKNIDLLMDVNLPVSIELGRTKMSISDILALGPGSVVELSKLAGEPVDLLVNYKIVARGEVVVVDENFGVRVTQLLTPEERLKALGDD
ncbi:MAG: flagellar motor switch protein FliN [Candidatus Zixiibacteriota bacterium]